MRNHEFRITEDSVQLLDIVGRQLLQRRSTATARGTTTATKSTAHTTAASTTTTTATAHAKDLGNDVLQSQRRSRG